MKIVIIGALEVEVSDIKKELKDRFTSTNAGFVFHHGDLGEHHITVIKSGVGKVAAALVTQMAIDLFQPDFIINTGCAGAMDKNLKIGDIVIGEHLTEWDLDTTGIGDPKSYIQELDICKFESCHKSIKPFVDALSKEFTVYKGLIATGDQFVCRDDQKNYILKYFPETMCVEMEGGSVAHVCTQNNIPFCVIRTISDTADHTSHINYASFCAEAGKKSAHALIKMLYEIKDGHKLY